MTRRCVLAASLALGAAAAPPASAQEASVAEQAGPTGAWDFTFGSYGRVVGASNLRGGTGKQLNVVGHGPRIEEAPYLELDLASGYDGGGADFDVVVTMAVTDALFHLDGDFDGAIALRNAFVRAGGFGVEGLTLWAGSRMYRGDDVYLLDFWPLDDLNTVGGGARYDLAATETTIAVHAGVNQLRDEFQYQEITVAGPSFETEQLILMDRARTLASVRVEQRMLELVGDLSAKAVLWFDHQSIGEGTYENDDDVRIDLPADRGFTVGGQLGAWGFAPGAFVNVFVRHSRGLAAYDELAIPHGLDTDRTATDARLTRLALSTAYESRWFGATLGAYVDWFADADGARYDPDDYLEGAIAVRPIVFVTDHFHQAFEASYQRRVPEGLSARTDTYLEPAMWKLGVMPTLSLDRGVFSRPQLRAIYSASFLNDGARNQWPEGDVRHDESVHHFLGVGVEWWFHSQTYADL